MRIVIIATVLAITGCERSPPRRGDPVPVPHTEPPAPLVNPTRPLPADRHPHFPPPDWWRRRYQNTEDK